MDQWQDRVVERRGGNFNLAALLQVAVDGDNETSFLNHIFSFRQVFFGKRFARLHELI